jgi:cell division protein FtsL
MSYSYASSTYTGGYLSSQIIGRRPKSTAKKMPLSYMAAAVFLFVSLLGQLTVRVQYMELGYALEASRAEALKYDARYRELKVEQALLTRPTRLTEMANNKIGLEPTSPQQVRRVSESNLINNAL